MTEQYAKRNINDPAGISSPAGTTQLTAADVGTVVFFDTSAGAATITLPTSAEAGAGAEIVLVFPDANTGNATVAIAGGDTLVTPAAAPANPATTANATKTLRADGVLSWFIVSGLA